MGRAGLGPQGGYCQGTHSLFPTRRCLLHPLPHLPLYLRHSCLPPGDGAGPVHQSGRHHCLEEDLPHLWGWVTHARLKSPHQVINCIGITGGFSSSADGDKPLGLYGKPSTCDSVGMSLSKLRERVKDREALHTAVHGVTKSRTQLSNWTTPLVGPREN